ncbi:MAG: hypothetical protein OXG96_09650 [Acidobacteria bacterium]|nr:hypothetical protein [Acidobacteriota bacterium]
MTTITFDTRKAVRNLPAAGLAEVQADAMVDTLAEAFTDTVATKSDIAEVKTEIAKLKTDLLKVALGIAVVIILANATLTFGMLCLLLQ